MNDLTIVNPRMVTPQFDQYGKQSLLLFCVSFGSQDGLKEEDIFISHNGLKQFVFYSTCKAFLL